MIKHTKRPLSKTFALPALLVGLLSFCYTSCGVIPKKYPVGRPFVFKTTIKVEGNLNRTEKELLQSKLKGQLDDSLRSRTVSKLFYSTLPHPPVFDTSYSSRSVEYMHALLIAQGYFSHLIKVDTLLTRVGKDQQRVAVNFHVQPGAAYLLDTVRYALSDSSLQALTIQSSDQAKIGKGKPFAKGIIGDELDRLVDLYRNNGYLRFTKDELVGVWDTLDAAILKPAVDPLEQLQLLARINARGTHPTAQLDIQLRPTLDSSKLRAYHIGTISVYPDFSPDTLGLTPRKSEKNGVAIYQFRPSFHEGIFNDKIHFKTGERYDQRNYFKTLNQLNAMGAWRLVNVETPIRINTDTADVLIKLTPARKYATVANIEGSSNQSILAGNLFGLAMNFGIQNRNLWKRSIQSNTNLRLGVETGRDTVADVRFIQTRQIAFSHTLVFPGMIPRFQWLPAEAKQNARSILAFNISNTERRELFNLSSYSAAWGYDLRYKQKLFTVRLPNIEYNKIARRAKLLELINNNALLKNIFVDGLIISANAGFFYNHERKNQVQNIRFNLEESGLLSGMIRSPLVDESLFRFIKMDLDLSTKYNFKKSALAIRFFAGTGYALDQTRNPVNRYNLPLYRQYFAGGPNSMRAWGLRKLGPGSSIQEFGNRGLPERYGDMQLETNLEFRFPWFTVAGMQVNGAVFTDIGNIWFIKKAPGRMPEEIFKLSRLGKDLAVGVGTGLRLDFTYFVIRFDYSIKAKDPSPAPAFRAYQNKWFGYPTWKDMDQFQLGINYPFNL